jgi:nitrogen fixation protein FixH
MSTTSASPALRQWNPWPVSIAAFFTVAVLGCAGMVVFCSRQPTELVAADYYDQEVHFQGQMEGVQRAQQQGQASVGYDAATRRITVSLPPDSLRGNVAGTVQLYRPSSVALDRKVKFEPGTDGIQTIDAASLQPGLWKVRLAWTVNGEDYYSDQRLNIPH